MNLWHYFWWDVLDPRVNSWRDLWDEARRNGSETSVIHFNPVLLQRSIRESWRINRQKYIPCELLIANGMMFNKTFPPAANINAQRLYQSSNFCVFTFHIQWKVIKGGCMKYLSTAPSGWDRKESHRWTGRPAGKESDCVEAEIAASISAKTNTNNSRTIGGKCSNFTFDGLMRQLQRLPNIVLKNTATWKQRESQIMEDIKGIVHSKIP